MFFPLLNKAIKTERFFVFKQPEKNNVEHTLIALKKKKTKIFSKCKHTQNSKFCLFPVYMTERLTVNFCTIQSKYF